MTTSGASGSSRPSPRPASWVSQLVLLRGDHRTATALWFLGVALWAILTYGIFTALAVGRNKPSLAEGIHGGWLLAVVATQSVAVLGTLLAPSYPAHREEILFFCLMLWLGGGVLYVWLTTLIVYRLAFLPLDPADLTPPYWIDMGAMAISTLAGAGLAASGPHSPLLGEFAPFLKGVTLLCWSTATLWIPMLVILGIWRHLPGRIPLRYNPAYWAAVFPLGMYSACTARLIGGLPLPFLAWIALAAWLLTGVGFVRNLFR